MLLSLRLGQCRRRTQHRLHATDQQRGHVPTQPVTSDGGQAAHALPKFRRSERQHHERQNRVEQQRGFQLTIDRAIQLRVGDTAAELPDVVEWNALHHPFAQQAAFVDDLPQPERW